MPRQASLATHLKLLQTSRFPQVVLAEGLRISEEAFESSNITQVEAVHRRELTEAEHHALAVSFAIAHLLGGVEQFVQTPGYLQGYVRTKSLARVGVTRASDITYHI